MFSLNQKDFLELGFDDSGFYSMFAHQESISSDKADVEIDYHPEINLSEDSYDFIFSSDISQLSSLDRILPVDQDTANLEAFDKCKDIVQSVKCGSEEGDQADTGLLTKTSSNSFNFDFMAEVLLENDDIDIDVLSETESTHDSKELKPKNKKKRSRLGAPRRRRKDIVFKSLLRRCRKHYQNEFNKFCSYSKVKKRRQDSFFFEQVINFIKVKYAYHQSDNLVFFMAALINSKDMIKSARYFLREDESLEELIAEINKVHDILYKFTHEKMHSFFEYTELRFLFTHYVGDQKQNIPKGFNQQLETMLCLA